MSSHTSTEFNDVTYNDVTKNDVTKNDVTLEDVRTDDVTNHVIVRWLGDMDCTFEDLYEDIERSFDTRVTDLMKNADEEYERLQNEIKHLKNDMLSCKYCTDGGRNDASRTDEATTHRKINNGHFENPHTTASSVLVFKPGGGIHTEDIYNEPDSVEGSDTTSTTSNGSTDIGTHIQPPTINNNHPHHLSKSNLQKLTAIDTVKHFSSQRSPASYLGKPYFLDKTTSLDAREGLLDFPHHMDGGYMTSDELEEAADCMINAMSKLCNEKYNNCIAQELRDFEHIPLNDRMTRKKMNID